MGREEIQCLEESIRYLEEYIHVTNDMIDKIMKHAVRYNIKPEICAWYEDWEDFCADWCDRHVGYARTKARKILHGGLGEFMVLSGSSGIVRFVL